MACAEAAIVGRSSTIEFRARVSRFSDTLFDVEIFGKNGIVGTRPSIVV